MFNSLSVKLFLPCLLLPLFQNTGVWALTAIDKYTCIHFSFNNPYNNSIPTLQFFIINK